MRNWIWRIPGIYRLRVAQLRVQRRLHDAISGRKFAKTRVRQIYMHTGKKHQSLLRRKLGTSDPQLQENKITNLRLSIEAMDGILIRPGETFSFWRLIGRTTARKGYLEGLQLSKGEVKTGVGGGLCQLANLLYWMALHSPLEVVERHHDSFDPFPDEQRVLPFGSGASVFFNYIDLRFYNPTDVTFQFKLWLTDTHLKGSLHSDREWKLAYHIEEKNHRFLRQGGLNFRENEIWRRSIDKSTGNVLKEEQLIRNFSEVKYELPQHLIYIEQKAQVNQEQHE